MGKTKSYFVLSSQNFDVLMSIDDLSAVLCEIQLSNCKTFVNRFFICSQQSHNYSKVV